MPKLSSRKAPQRQRKNNVSKNERNINKKRNLRSKRKNKMECDFEDTSYLESTAESDMSDIFEEIMDSPEDADISSHLNALYTIAQKTNHPKAALAASLGIARMNARPNGELAQSLKEALSEKEFEVDPRLLKLFDTTIYPKIFLGLIDIEKEMKYVHPKMKALGVMNERKKNLFTFINTVLNFPSSIKIAKRVGDLTLKQYRTYLARYVRFIADTTKIDAENFIVDGIHMERCFAELIKAEPQGNTPGVTHDSSRQFRAALTLLHEMLGVYQTRHIEDEFKRADEIKKKYTEIPRVEKFNNFCVGEKQTEFETTLEMYYNKGRHEMFQKKYTIADLKKMMINMYELTGTNKKGDIYDGINAVLEFLTGHHLLFRGHNKMALELSDSVFSEEETANGIVPILGFQFIKGKTLNPKTPPGLLGVCRHKDVEICLVSAYALSLWYRFDYDESFAPLTGKNKLDFLDKLKWYDAKVLFTARQIKNLHKPVSPNYTNKLVKLCLDSIGFTSVKKMHIGRSTNAFSADANRVSESQIRRAGRWRLDVLQSRYMSSYAYDFIHYTAGFKPDEPYFIPRNIAVPDQLQKMIFPWLEEVIEKVANRPDQDPDILKRDDTAPEFLDLLYKFRSVIIQDLALLIEKAPNSIYAKHPIVKEPLFQQFKKDLEYYLQNCSLFPDTKEIREAADILAPGFQSKIVSVKVAMDKLNHSFVENAAAQERGIRNISLQLPQIVAEGINDGNYKMLEHCSALSNINITKLMEIHRESMEYNMKAKKDYQDLKIAVSNMHIKVDNLENIMKQLLQKVSAMMANPLPSLTNACLQADTLVQENNISDKESNSRERRFTAEKATVGSAIYSGPEFQMLRNVQTIPLLLQEWFVSSHNRLSIEARNAQYGKQWRLENESIHKRKKVFITFIRDAIRGKKITVFEYGELLEMYRVEKKLSMTTLGPILSNAEKRPEVARAVMALLSSRRELK